MSPPYTFRKSSDDYLVQEYLRMERIGINDNFFELGGDSILSIQIISVARREGLRLTPKLLFAHQTIAALASVAGLAERRARKEESSSGDVPLTPIQEWFFEQNLEDPAQYNQAFLLEVSESMDQSLLKSALQQVGRQHDALRLRYVRVAKGWRQSFSSSEEPAPLNWICLAICQRASKSDRWNRLPRPRKAALIWRTVRSGALPYFDLGLAGPPGC